MSWKINVSEAVGQAYLSGRQVTQLFPLRQSMMNFVFCYPKIDDDSENNGRNVESVQIGVHSLSFFASMTARDKNKTVAIMPKIKVTHENAESYLGANIPITNDPKMILAPSLKNSQRMSDCLSVNIRQEGYHKQKWVSSRSSRQRGYRHHNPHLSKEK